VLSGFISWIWTPRSGAASNLELLASVIGQLDVDVELSGGIRDAESLRAALATGCARVNLGTAALASPGWVQGAIAEYGDKIAAGWTSGAPRSPPAAGGATAVTCGRRWRASTPMAVPAMS
jgi:2,4-dienoyl-CoA reductase-like NADH-dependent reductase (Old Yellow Enzyme family)